MHKSHMVTTVQKDIAAIHASVVDVVKPTVVKLWSLRHMVKVSPTPLRKARDGGTHNRAEMLLESDAAVLENGDVVEKAGVAQADDLDERAIVRSRIAVVLRSRNRKLSGTWLEDHVLCCPPDRFRKAHAVGKGEVEHHGAAAVVCPFEELHEGRRPVHVHHAHAPIRVDL